MKKMTLLATCITASLALASPAMAEKGSGSWWSSFFNSSPKKDDDVLLLKNFTSEERAIIRTVFDELFPNDTEDRANQKKSKGAKAMPHGLAKRDRLPPGLEKQIEKNGTLPPGLAKRDLPDELVRRLPKRGKGQEVVWVDDDVYLIETATRVVLDVVRDVLR
jgi:hypothetical protein